MLGSPVDIAIVAGIILIVFGPKKVPELGRALGQGIGNFKKALTEASDEVKAGVASVTEDKPKEDAAVASASTASANPAATKTADGAATKEESAPPA